MAIIVLLTACSLEEEVVDEVSGDSLLNEPGAELNVIAPTYAYLHWAYLKLRSTIWGLNELAGDDLMIPCRTGGNWCEGPDQWIHDHSWTVTHPYLSDNWKQLETAVARANVGLFLLQEQLSGDPDLNQALQAELRLLRAYFRYWQLDFYRQIPLRDERDQDYGTPPPVLQRAAAFDWLEQELLAVLPLLQERDAVPRGRVHRDVARVLLAKLYLNAEIYIGVARWEDALSICQEMIAAGKYQLAGDYFSMFSQQNQFSNPEAIWVIPQSPDLGASSFHGAAWDLHYNQQLGIGAFTLNGYVVGPQFLASWDTTDARYRDDRIRPATGINLGFLVGPQYHPDGSPIEDRERTAVEGVFVQLDYTPQISTFRGAPEREGARAIKYEPFLAINNLFPLGAADFLIFRFADVHLMAAEALFRLGKTEEARIMINNLRRLRGVPALNSLTADDVLRERGYEFYREGYRRQDLIRFGRFTDAWDFKPPSEEFRIVFPIPRTALDVNPNLIQNPGY